MTTSENPNDRYLKTLLTLIAGLLVAIIIELAMLISPGLPAAQAQIPDSGEQRERQMELIRQTNQKLDDLKGILREQVLKVRVVASDTDKKPVPLPVQPSARPVKK